MLDFTSSLYLGLAHEHAGLRPWSRMTTGTPAALRTLPGSGAVAADLARLSQSEAAVLTPSTLHAFHDLSLLWPARTHALYLDSGAYEIAKWGAAMAASRGMRVRQFRHHDPASLCRALQKDRACGRVPLVVTDGYCPGCGAAAPLAAYAGSTETFGGWLVVDDTQAFGVLGRAPSARSPFGTGGGGTAPWLDFRHPRLVIAASLAKGFGVPLAVVAGARRLIERFERSSETRTHCSPVAAPALHAAENAIAFNHHAGDRARASLSQLVSRLRRKLQTTPLEPAGGLFPSLSIAGTQGLTAEDLHLCLQRMEIQTVLQRQRVSGEPRLGVLITALHGNRDIDRLAEALLGLLEGLPEHQTNIRKRGERDGLRSGIRI